MEKKEKKEFPFAVNPSGWSPELLTYIYHQSELGTRSDFMRKAAEFYYEYLFYKKGFLTRLIQEDFQTCKHILRQVGNSLYLQNEKEKEFMEKS